MLSLAVAVPALAACFAEPSPHNAVKEFLVGWQTGDYTAAARRTDGDPKQVGQALENVKLQLDAASIRFSLQGVTTEGDNADARFHVEVDLGDNNPLWLYDNDLPLHLVDGEWKVRWSPSVIHPELRAGQRFAVDATSEGRQPILDRNGDPLQEEATLYVAGVVPATLKDRETLCEQLFQLTGFAQDRLLSRIVSAPPQSFVPLVTFGRAKYAQLRDRLDGISGLQIEKKQQPVAPAQPVEIIGKVGAITAETEQQLGGPQRAGDTLGQGGLQKAYQDQLTGSTGTRVITYDLKSGEQVAELARWEGRLNTSVKTTLDKGVQRAADAAAGGSSVPSLLVAVKASTGDILAVGSRQLHQERDALAGRFPPGTAFSLVAADGLLEAGVDPGQKVPCPPDRTVGGARFVQTSAITGTAPTLTTDFAHGCVTALAALARRVDAETLSRSAGRFGIGADWTLPLRSYSGSVPVARTDAAKARVITGQTVRVSPLSMALAAAAVASGTWHPPTLVTSSSATDLTAEVAPVSPPKPITLDSASLEKLRSMMRSGVTTGAATAAATPGPPVYGVVSTVTYTDKKRQRTLSWFVGWQGDTAIAVLTETPTPTVPAQMAGQFFRSLPAAS
ncbi:penicillin-binding transpeptidase domain-containing protein [Sphaerisporangium rubeum]|uniref:penicillin-binding transpeptidase domain-containing protein n=1 Tax=Sphaerisporangium rubeum TaxID=321317 RepID=UPI0031D835E3